MALRSERKWKKKRNGKKRTHTGRRTTWKTYQSADVDHHGRSSPTGGLKYKAPLFSRFGVFRHDLRERLIPIRKKAVMTQSMLSPSDKAQTRKRANKDAYAINDRDFSPWRFRRRTRRRLCQKHIFEITDARYKAENNHFFHTHQSIMRPDVPSKDHKAIGPARPWKAAVSHHLSQN